MQSAFFNRAFILFLAGCVLSLASAACFAQVDEDRVRAIQSAFLLQFSNYVTWPEASFSDEDAALVIGILGRDPFGSVLDNTARTFTSSKRRLEIRRYKNLDDLGQVHILFVSPFLEFDKKALAAAVGASPVLLVGNAPGFLESGSVNFILRDKKVRFDINRSKYQRAGLRVSAKLLSVANRVVE